jgi:hypothetical protein
MTLPHGYSSVERDDPDRSRKPLEIWWWGQNTADHLWRARMHHYFPHLPDYFDSPALVAIFLRAYSEYFATLAARVEALPDLSALADLEITEGG